MKKFALFVLLLSPFSVLRSQELNCQVQVLSPQIQGTTEKHIFETLQKAIFEFMNTTKWTTDIFDVSERISCNLTLTIATKNADECTGSLQIQSSRPVYKSSYSSVLINHNDPDIDFKYVEYSPLDFSISSHLSNLTSILAYWAYVIIAEDYDTYSLNGGTPYWQKAQTIVTNAQNAPEKGWKSMDGTKNRYWIADSPLQPTFSPMREFMYKYHRLGLDVMYNDVNGGRAICLEALQLLEKVHDAKPLSFAMQFLFNAKVDELVNMFIGGLPDEKSKAAVLLQKIDPGHGVQWQKITATQ